MKMLLAEHLEGDIEYDFSNVPTKEQDEFEVAQTQDLVKVKEIQARMTFFEQGCRDYLETSKKFNELIIKLNDLESLDTKDIELLIKTIKEKTEIAPELAKLFEKMQWFITDTTWPNLRNTICSPLRLITHYYGCIPEMLDKENQLKQKRENQIVLQKLFGRWTGEMSLTREIIFPEPNQSFMADNLCREKHKNGSMDFYSKSEFDSENQDLSSFESSYLMIHRLTGLVKLINNFYEQCKKLEKDLGPLSGFLMDPDDDDTRTDLENLEVYKEEYFLLKTKREKVQDRLFGKGETRQLKTEMMNLFLKEIFPLIGNLTKSFSLISCKDVLYDMYNRKFYNWSLSDFKRSFKYEHDRPYGIAEGLMKNIKPDEIIEYAQNIYNSKFEFLERTIDLVKKLFIYYSKLSQEFEEAIQTLSEEEIESYSVYLGEDLHPNKDSKRIHDYQIYSPHSARVVPGDVIEYFSQEPKKEDLERLNGDNGSALLPESDQGL